MRPKSHKPRFLTREAILAAIDRKERLALKHGLEGERCDQAYKAAIIKLEQARQSGKRATVDYGLETLKDKANRAWARRKAVLGSEMARLKNKLSELMTPMALVGTGRDDDSVNA